MKKKSTPSILLILFLLILFTVNGNAQLPVTDVAANAQLAVLNSQLTALLSTNVETSITNSSSLTESLTQGQLFVKQFQEVKNIQKQLSTVSGYVRTFNHLNKALSYTLKSFNLFINITKKLRNIPEFKGAKLTQSIDVLNSLLEDNNDIMASLNRMLTSDGIKTDEGVRLQIIENYEKEIKLNYQKLYSMNNLIGQYFPEPISIKD